MLRKLILRSIHSSRPLLKLSRGKRIAQERAKWLPPDFSPQNALSILSDFAERERRGDFLTTLRNMLWIDHGTPKLKVHLEFAKLYRRFPNITSHFDSSFYEKTIDFLVNQDNSESDKKRQDVIEMLVNDAQRFEEFTPSLVLALIAYYGKKDAEKGIQVLEKVPMILWNIQFIQECRVHLGEHPRYHLLLQRFWDQIVKGEIALDSSITREMLVHFTSLGDEQKILSFFRDLQTMAEQCPLHGRRKLQIMYNYKIKYYSEIGDSANMYKAFDELNQLELVNCHSCIYIIRRLMLEMKYDDADKFLNEILEKEMPWDESFVGELMLRLAYSTLDSRVLEVVEQAEKRGIRLDSRAYYALERLTEGDINNTLEIIQTLKEKNMPVSFKMHINLLEKYMISNQYDVALQEFHELRQNQIQRKSRLRLYNDFLRLHCLNGLYEDAIPIIQLLLKSGLKPDKETLLWSGKIFQHCNQHDQVTEIWKKLMTYGPLPALKM